MAEYWTFRYSGERVAPGLVTLRAPLQHLWAYKAPQGRMLGFVRAGAAGWYTSTGSGLTARLDPASGQALWTEPNDCGPDEGAYVISLWPTGLIASGLRTVRWLDPGTGARHRLERRSSTLGLPYGFVVDGLFVSSELEVLRLENLETVWMAKPKLRSAEPHAGNRDSLVWTDDGDVTCVDLETGAPRWSHTGKDLGGRPSRPGCIWDGKFIVVANGLRAFDLVTGKQVWHWPLPRALYWWHPYAGRAYLFIGGATYVIVDLATGQEVFRRTLGPTVPLDPTGRLRASKRERQPPSWHSTKIVVSETHAFLDNDTGHVVALKRDTGEVEQVLETGSMNLGLEPAIYDNHLFRIDDYAVLHCYKGSS